MYRNGDGIDKDNDKAFEFATKSAEGKNLNGINLLGIFYSKGVGTSVDKQRAFELYKTASDLGHKSAKSNLAILYKKGEGTERDYEKAAELYKQLYSEGYSNAFGILLDCFDVDTEEKDEMKETFGGKSTSLINVFIDGMSEEEKLSVHEFVAKLGKPLSIINPIEVVENYKTGEGIFKNMDPTWPWEHKIALAFRMGSNSPFTPKFQFKARIDRHLRVGPRKCIGLGTGLRFSVRDLRTGPDRDRLYKIIIYSCFHKTWDKIKF
ncbi:HCP-like protein [Rhizophagus irregularis]|uniref:HCP-like protein n=1 Tax=Rhizophagus irregularis TaxID=588596 RepID=A0A2I1G5Q6_9GLOM|nr:HCP-like protein [Rhizophagus irregularis]